VAAGLLTFPPVQVQGLELYFPVEMTLSPSAADVYVGASVTVIVTLSSKDGAPHNIRLATNIGIVGDHLVQESFSPDPVRIPSVGSATATLVLSVLNGCPSMANSGPYSSYGGPGSSMVQAYEEKAQGSMLVSEAPILLTVIYNGPPLTVSIDTDKSTYVVGEPVSVTMKSNLPAEYSLVVMEPDGTTWASTSGTLPARHTFVEAAGPEPGIYTAQLVAHYCGTAYASLTYDVGETKGSATSQETTNYLTVTTEPRTPEPAAQGPDVALSVGILLAVIVSIVAFGAFKRTSRRAPRSRPRPVRTPPPKETQDEDTKDW
jgi:hypothetical protein